MSPQRGREGTQGSGGRCRGVPIGPHGNPSKCVVRDGKLSENTKITTQSFVHQTCYRLRESGNQLLPQHTGHVCMSREAHKDEHWLSHRYLGKLSDWWAGNQGPEAALRSGPRAPGRRRGDEAVTYQSTGTPGGRTTRGFPGTASPRHRGDVAFRELSGSSCSGKPALGAREPPVSTAKGSPPCRGFRDNHLQLDLKAGKGVVIPGPQTG